ncbi:serine/threonine protein kinase, partial [bacterium]|nr:serine/threonine protein kinase [bacterium]
MSGAAARESCPRCRSSFPAGRIGACPRCFFEGALEPAVIGGVLELEDEIGRGGMGTVYRAKHLRLGRSVAVKFLPEELASRPEFRARFEREARALALLNHPHVVTVHDIGDESGQLYMVLELVEGGSLRAHLPVSLGRAAEIAAQVADALAYAHSKGVVHRDVKPENILLDAHGRAKVADFGIARMLAPDARGWTVTGRDLVAGTPRYMAPEALAGAPPDPRMDIYSLGVVLHELATGRLPMGAFDPAPAPLDRIVLRALAEDPSRRYASASEMQRDLLLARSSLVSVAAADTGAQGASTPTPITQAPASVAATPSSPPTPPAPSPPTPAPTAPSPDAPEELPADERSWMRAVALLQSISTAVALKAFLECATPRKLRPDEVQPLVMIPGPRGDDGLVVVWARFELAWALATLVTFAVAISCYALLRAHWRRARLELARPDRPVRESRLVLLSGVVALLVYLAHRAAGQDGLAVYAPIVGGAIEVVTLCCLWVSILEAWRTSRP